MENLVRRSVRISRSKSSTRLSIIDYKTCPGSGWAHHLSIWPGMRHSTSQFREPTWFCGRVAHLRKMLNESYKGNIQMTSYCNLDKIPVWVQVSYGPSKNPTRLTSICTCIFLSIPLCTYLSNFLSVDKISCPLSKLDKATNWGPLLRFS